MDSKQLRDTVGVYNNPGSSLNQLSAAGEIFLLHLYGFPKAGTLDKARYAMYKRTIARQPLTSKFDLATLPPTSASSRLHFARVYLQVQAWRGIQLNPLDWGWHMVSGKLMPIQSQQEPAPPYLLNLIMCNCRGNCRTNNCECHRSGLLCSSLCGHCAGVSCGNAAPNPELQPEVDEELDEEAVDDPS